MDLTSELVAEETLFRLLVIDEETASSTSPIRVSSFKAVSAITQKGGGKDHRKKIVKLQEHVYRYTNTKY